MPDPTPAADRVVRDQHGTPLPGTGGPDDRMRLEPTQIAQALDGLPGWQRQGLSLVRQFAVEAGSTHALRDAVQEAAGGQCNLSVEERSGSLIMRIGVESGDLTAGHVEAAARVDRALSGSAPSWPPR